MRLSRSRLHWREFGQVAFGLVGVVVSPVTQDTCRDWARHCRRPQVALAADRLSPCVAWRVAFRLLDLLTNATGRLGGHPHVSNSRVFRVVRQSLGRMIRTQA